MQITNGQLVYDSVRYTIYRYVGVVHFFAEVSPAYDVLLQDIRQPHSHVRVPQDKFKKWLFDPETDDRDDRDARFYLLPDSLNILDASDYCKGLDAGKYGRSMGNVSHSRIYTSAYQFYYNHYHREVSDK